MTIEASIWTPGETLNADTNSKRVVHRFVATAGQTEFTIPSFSYVVGVNALAVYKNGAALALSVDYYEVGDVAATSNDFTLEEPCVVGDIIYVEGFTELSGSSVVADAEDVTATIGAVNIDVQTALNTLYNQLEGNVKFVPSRIVALSQDLSQFDLLIVISVTSGWAGTATGPINYGDIYFRDNNVSVPDAGTTYPDDLGFWDGVGTGFSKVDRHPVYRPDEDFTVGDGAEASITYSASSGVLTIGEDVIFNNKTIGLGQEKLTISRPPFNIDELVVNDSAATRILVYVPNDNIFGNCLAFGDTGGVPVAGDILEVSDLSFSRGFYGTASHAIAFSVDFNPAAGDETYNVSVFRFGFAAQADLDLSIGDRGFGFLYKDQTDLYFYIKESGVVATEYLISSTGESILPIKLITNDYQTFSVYLADRDWETQILYLL